MRICVFGAGAIGSWLAARLSATAAEVSMVARGPHLEAMRERGLTVESAAGREVFHLRATDTPAELGPQDYVILTLKAHSITPALPAILPLLGESTAVVTAQNGIPWWYFHALDGPLAGQRLTSVDPDGRIWETLTPERVIGCVVYPSCELVAPGAVRHLDGRRMMLGEPDGARTPRVEALAESFAAAGLRAPVRLRLRDDIWFKLLGNLSFNPLSVLTGATLVRIAGHGPTRALARSLMEEGARVAAALGARIRVDLDRRISWAEAAGEHRTSMLQDFESGRPLELAALVGAVGEMGRLVGEATPLLDAVEALVDLRSKVRDGRA